MEIKILKHLFLFPVDMDFGKLNALILQGYEAVCKNMFLVMG